MFFKKTNWTKTVFPVFCPAHPTLPGLCFQTKYNDTIICGLEPKDLIDKTPQVPPYGRGGFATSKPPTIVLV
jgi:hypothetical protein